MDPLFPQAGRSSIGGLSGGLRLAKLNPTDVASRKQPIAAGEQRPNVARPGDSVQISAQAYQRSLVDAEGRAQGAGPVRSSGSPNDQNGTVEADLTKSATSGNKNKAAGSSPDSLDLSDEELDQVRKMRTRDGEVRAHEQAHMSAGGSLTGAPSYEYERGPDGNQYAVAGEVGISIPSGGSPQENVSNARQVRRAALAPAQPSGQDRSVAAQAAQMEAQAQADLAKESLASSKSESGEQPQEGGGTLRPNGGATARVIGAYEEVANATQEDPQYVPFAKTA